MYLGDFVKGETIKFSWNSSGADGASITRATNGTISVYKDGNTTQTTTGVTDTEDFDSLTGVHYCEIATTNSFYVAGSEYLVVLSAATIDGKTVNAVLAHFSIQRKTALTPVIGLAQAGASGTVTLPSTAVATDDYYNGAIVSIASGTGAGQSRFISDYVGSTKVASVSPNWTTTPDTTSVLVVTAQAPIATTDTTALAKAVVEEEWTALKSLSRTGTNGNSGLAITMPNSGAQTSTISTNASAAPVVDFG